MHDVRDLTIQTVTIDSLYPTQITVGMREVRAKRKHWRSVSRKDAFLGRHLIPVIRGAKDRYYVIDHHHLALALHQEGVKAIAITVVADLGRMGKDEFWTYLDNRGWMHPYDDKGRRRPPRDIPRHVSGLADDPFRSLAGELRRAGGFSKETTPFSEFVWADFLRRRIKRARVEDNFTLAIEQALRLAKSTEADYLPGWCGPVPRE
jgi:hypothetical protein